MFQQEGAYQHGSPAVSLDEEWLLFTAQSEQQSLQVEELYHAAPALPPEEPEAFMARGSSNRSRAHRLSRAVAESSERRRLCRTRRLG